eukprot:351479-Chlamydomonas_euryale.AAC.8
MPAAPIGAMPIDPGVPAIPGAPPIAGAAAMPGPAPMPGPAAIIWAPAPFMPPPLGGGMPAR